MIMEILKNKVSVCWPILFFIISLVWLAVADVSTKNKIQKIQTLTVERDALIAQLGSLKAQSEAQNNRVALAKKNAELDLKTSKLDVKKLMEAKLPLDCAGAVNWARKQASTI
jgi:hypothetical protein